MNISDQNYFLYSGILQMLISFSFIVFAYLEIRQMSKEPARAALSLTLAAYFFRVAIVRLNASGADTGRLDEFFLQPEFIFLNAVLIFISLSLRIWERIDIRKDRNGYNHDEPH